MGRVGLKPPYSWKLYGASPKPLLQFLIIGTVKGEKEKRERRKRKRKKRERMKKNGG
jgi:heme exporter protein D